MPVDTPESGFIIEKAGNSLKKEHQASPQHALEEAVSRALRDNLAPLQRTAEELQQAYGDLVAACSSSRPTNALPAMLRAQTAASALAAGLSVLSNFVAVALKPRDNGAGEPANGSHASVATEAPPAQGFPAAAQEAASDWSEVEEELPAASHGMPVYPPAPEAPAQAPIGQAIASETGGFDVRSLPSDEQELHRRANRVAKVAMQDIKLLRPKDVRLGREHQDICTRLRSDLDKARKEYDRRFRAIQDHPVDYFHHWMVEILAEGDTKALGEYPYPSPVLRH